MRKTAAILLALAMILTLCVACESKAPDDAKNDPKVTLVYAEVNPEDSLMGKTALAFKSKVEELSGGSVIVDIQFSGTLGSENDVLDSMLGNVGTVDLARISAFSLNSYGTKLAKLLSIPYTFTGREHFWKFAASELGSKVLNEPLELGLGVKGLFFAEEGFRHFFFRSEVTDINSLKGTKIRVSTDPVMVGMVEGLGASATVVSFNELYSALQSGVVDGAEQPIVNYKSNSFNEVAPYMILDAHTLGAAEVIITESAWNKMTAGQQNAVMEASKYASSENGKLSEGVEQDAIAALKAAGAKFVEVPDKTAWQAAVKSVADTNIVGYESEYQQILDMAK